MNVLLMTGESGVGKSTIAHSVAAARNGVHLPEREVSRTIARELGYERSRQWVSEVGLTRAAANIRERTIEFARLYLPDKLVVVDGAYDRHMPAAFRQALPQVVLGIVTVEAPQDLRVQRCAERMGGIALQEAVTELTYLDSIKYEVGMDELVNAADLVITNDCTLQAAEAQVHALLNHYAKATFAVPRPQAAI